MHHFQSEMLSRQMIYHLRSIISSSASMIALYAMSKTEKLFASSAPIEAQLLTAIALCSWWVVIEAVLHWCTEWKRSLTVVLGFEPAVLPHLHEAIRCDLIMDDRDETRKILPSANDIVRVE
jgi:hypothetical protein